LLFKKNISINLKEVGWSENKINLSNNLNYKKMNLEIEILLFKEMTDQDWDSVIVLSNEKRSKVFCIVDTISEEHDLYVMQGGFMWCVIYNVPRIWDFAIRYYMSMVVGLSIKYTSMRLNYEDLIREFDLLMSGEV
jgi:hypothetical protein